MTSPVEVLRSAAVLLRQRAEAATQGPWRREYPGGPSTTVVDYADVMVVAGVRAREIWPKPVDANYITTVHPLVGLALADLLQVLSWFPSKSDPTDLSAAVRLARLILGEPLPEPYDGFRPVETVHLPVLGDSS